MGDTAEFAAGLLDPQYPVPALVKGQIARRYAVYRNNVTVGLIRALEANFPVVRRLLGEEYFAGFARDFAQIHPPLSPLMFQYGADFPQALEQAEDLVSYPYLGDIARLKLLWRESYHAADAQPLGADSLASIDPDALFDSRFNVHPATRLLQSRFAIQAIFAANRFSGGGFDPACPQQVVIVRPHHDVSVHAVSPGQCEFFRAMTQGERLGEALDRVADLNTDFDLSNTLALLLQSGAFQSIQTGNEKKS